MKLPLRALLDTNSLFSLLIASNCFESNCLRDGIGIRIGVWFLFCCFLGLLLREDKSVGLGLGLGFGSCFVIVLWVC